MADTMRSLNSFGVAGLLAVSAEVLYSNDLRARNIGRVSDLLAAKMRDRQIDELRLRALLAYGLFLSYAVRGERNQHSEEVPVVSAEIGFDFDYVAVGVSFHWEGAKAPKISGLLERLKAGSPGDAFETILSRMEVHSSQLIVRYEAKERRIEVVALMNQHYADLRDPTMVVAVNADSAPLIEVGKYVELGDLDYAKLLRTTTLADDLESEGLEDEETVESDSVKVTEDAVIFSGPAVPESEVETVASTLSEDSSEFHFTGNSPEVEVEELRSMLGDYERTVSEMRATIGELQAKLEQSENRASEQRFSAEGSTEGESVAVVLGGKTAEPAKEDDWGIDFLKQVWPFAKKEEKATQVVRGAPVKTDAAITRVSGAKVAAVDESVEVVAGESPGIDEGEAMEALRELQVIAESKKSRKLEEKLAEISEELGGDKGRKWADSLSSEILQEKARLNELQKNIAKQMRQRELEFKTSELALKQELKRKEEMLRQKETALESKSDQIAQLNLAIERAGTASADKESQQMKVRLDRAQKLAQMKEEEARSLVAKMRDLENRLIVAQAKAQKSNDLQMQTKMQGLEKKIEEYKRVNQRLMESLNGQKDKSNDKEIGDMRRKVDLLERQLTESRRNVEKSSFKFKELQDSERKLQTDLARAVEENRNLRKSQSRGGGGESGGQAA